MRPPRPWLLAVLLTAPAAAGADYLVSTATLELQFSDSGALVGAAACYPRCATDGSVEVNSKRIRFGGAGQKVIDPGLPTGEWSMSPGIEGGARVLRFENARQASLTWRVPDQGYRLRLEVAADSGWPGLSAQSGAELRPRNLAGFGRWLERIRYVALPGRQADFAGERIELDEQSPTVWHTDGWAGFRNRYWALMVRPGRPASVEANTDRQRQDAAISIRSGPGERSFDIYLGPVEAQALAAADPALRGLLFGALWFWLRWISFALMWMLGAIHAGVALIVPAVPSWGIAIMLLSLAVHILMRPLMRIAERLQDDVHAIESRLAPELNEIKLLHRGEAQAERILALYKREGVHPLYSLKSLLGVALVIPVFIGAFDMLAENIHLLGVPFLWIADLSRPDAVARIPFDIPFFGSTLNLLPFLMTGLSIAASSLHHSPAQHPELRRKQLRNMLLLAAAFFILFYTFPSGMVLYWTTNNLISAIRGGWRHMRRPGQGAEQVEHG